MVKNNKGFTLTELLIVITIIGTLAALVIVNFRSAQMRGRDAVRKSDLRNIQTSLRLYYNDFGRYPASSPVAGGAIVGCGTLASASSCTYGQVWTRANTTYMSILPDEPLGTPDYVYAYVNDDDYTLRTCLESSSDPKCEVVATSVCSSTCRYTVRP